VECLDGDELARERAHAPGLLHEVEDVALDVLLADGLELRRCGQLLLGRSR